MSGDRIVLAVACSRICWKGKANICLSPKKKYSFVLLSPGFYFGTIFVYFWFPLLLIHSSSPPVFTAFLSVFLSSFLLHLPVHLFNVPLFHFSRFSSRLTFFYYYIPSHFLSLLSFLVTSFLFHFCPFFFSLFFSPFLSIFFSLLTFAFHSPLFFNFQISVFSLSHFPPYACPFLFPVFSYYSFLFFLRVFT